LALSSSQLQYRFSGSGITDIFSRSKIFTASGAAAILICVSAACIHRQTTGIFIDPAFKPLIPPDTKYMAGVRLDKIRETPVYKRLDGRFDLDRRLDLFSERTGLDPRKDLWYVLAASNGTDTLVLARGRFTTGEMEPKLGSLGKTRTRYKDYTLIGTPDTSVVFINAGIAAAGTQTVLRRLIDHRSEWMDVPRALAERLKTMPVEDQIWAVSDGGLPAGPLAGTDTTGMKSMASNLLNDVKAGVAGVHVDQGIEFKANVECVSENGSRRVRDLVKGGVGLARLNTHDDQRELLKVFDTVNVKQNGDAVSIEAQVAPDLVDPLLSMATKIRDARGR
jgi:hypothetical protein